jgi:CRP-like cAMP-binding protein
MDTFWRLSMDKLLYLSQINLFDEMPMDELEAIDNISAMKPLKKGKIILGPNNPTRALYLLKQGKVRLFRSSEDGKQLTVDLLGDGNVFGETSSFSLSDDQTYAEALSDVYLCVIGKDEFTKLIEQYPKLAIKFIEILSARLKETYEMSESLALRNVKYRMLVILLKLSEKFGRRNKEWQTIDIKITHHDLASMIGSTRETVSATFSQLKKDGFIKKSPLALKVNAEKAEQYLNKY